MKGKHHKKKIWVGDSNSEKKAETSLFLDIKTTNPSFFTHPTHPAFIYVYLLNLKTRFATSRLSHKRPTRTHPHSKNHNHSKSDGGKKMEKKEPVFYEEITRGIILWERKE